MTAPTKAPMTVPMEIPRPDLLGKLEARRENGMVKVVTGVRRCGKSYLLTKLFRDRLVASGVSPDHVIDLALDDVANARYRNPLELDAYVRAHLVDPTTMYYVFIDEKRNNVRNDAAVLGDLLNVISSSVGSLTNPTRLANTFRSERRMAITPGTVGQYLDYFVDAFLIDKVHRYDVKGNRYIATPLKYYFCDVGLRNARLNFRQQEENHLMENVLYNDLCARGFSVDVGVVEHNGTDVAGKKVRSQLEVDFVCNRGDRRYYVQSAWSMDSEEKRAQETASLRKIDDSFKKVVVVKDPIVPWHDDKGILYVGVEQFLLDERAIDG